MTVQPHRNLGAQARLGAAIVGLSTTIISYTTHRAEVAALAAELRQ